MKRMVCAVIALLLTGCAAGQRGIYPVRLLRMVSLRLPSKPPPRRRHRKVPPPLRRLLLRRRGLQSTDADVLDYDDIRLIG